MDIKEYLKKLNISFKEFKHKPVFTVEETKQEGIYKNIRGIHSKNLFLKDRKSRRFYLVVMPEDKPLIIKQLEEKIHDKIKFANPDNLKDILGLIPGSVSPFGLINDKDNIVNVLIDKEVWESSFVSFHPNINTETLELSKDDFHKYIDSLKNELKILEM
jgi:Ala-tRNA(Pro) deacylase